VRRVLPLAAIVVLLGCTETGLRPWTPLPPVTHTDTWFQEREDYADILLVVDDSGSMADEQEELAGSFEAFVQFIELADTHYHIGVTTTETDVPFVGLPDRAGELRGDPYFITPDTPDAAAVFRDAVRVGTSGSGWERGFEAARRALTEPLASGANAGFYRDEAALTLIFVSDEDDQSNDGPITYLQQFRQMKGDDERAVLAHGLFGLDPDDWEPGPCGAGDPYEGGATPGYRYFDFVEATGGIAAPICTGNFSQILFEMGQATTRVRDRFPLSWIPQPGTVRVNLAVPGTPEFVVGGFDVPRDGLGAQEEADAGGEYPWELERDLDGWWVRFVDPDSLPPPDTRVQAEYELAD
jgi:hypothetical protein